MERTRILLMSDSGAVGMMLSLRDICGMNRAGDFQVAEALLPAAGHGDFASILPPAFERSAPHLAVLCLSEEARGKTAMFFDVIRGHHCDVPVLLALESFA